MTSRHPIYSSLIMPPDEDDASAEDARRIKAEQRRMDEKRKAELEEAEYEQAMAGWAKRQEKERLELLRLEREVETSRKREQLARDQRRQSFATQREAQSRREVTFLETSVFALTSAMVERIVMVGKCGLLTGAPGVGKSRALREIVARGLDGRGRHAALIEMSGISGNSTKAVLEEVCGAVEVEPAGSIAETERRLCKQVDYAPVLLFDEAQNLTLTPLRVLLGLSETIGIPMLFCGNVEVLKRVSSKQAAFQQVARRLPIREEIACIMDEDVDLIADQFGVIDVEARQLCRIIGAMFHADGVANVLTQASLDVEEEAPIGAEDIRGALTWLPQFKAALIRNPAKQGQPARRSSLAAPSDRRG